MTDRDDQRVAKALQGADFPASRGSLLDYAETRGIDQKTRNALHTLPERRFASITEVVESVAHEPEGEDQPGGTAR
ncbi:uncharacterized protein DUF2795 [Haloactinopolyspora alba]|uniref:Uncharacterized protein DUF2795 n=1 Tax=Haloactinopolyspora alba TaxID=648780 RepID=A0A2P8D3U9_9ACTN|nr:DUF2795 domain-containing protein [Haloactinopolyspora alba]PSK91903.1 uncharacterized protein DUF2795 [Haloactinopolyspora alba]